MLNKINNPDAFGETIRDIVFVKKHEYEFGCYDTFYLTKDFYRIEREEDEFKRLVEMMCRSSSYTFSNEDYDLVEPIASAYTNGDITVAWFWDGDGTLLVGHNGRFAVNTDCKKDHGWKWVNVNLLRPSPLRQ